MTDLSGRDLAWLERRRAELFGLISQVGDFRRGALNAVWRKCGKPNCACAQPGHRGHGPQYNLTRRIGGETVHTHPGPGPELQKAGGEGVEHQRFAALVGGGCAGGPRPGRGGAAGPARVMFFPGGRVRVPRRARPPPSPRASGSARQPRQSASPPG